MVSSQLENFLEKFVETMQTDRLMVDMTSTSMVFDNFVEKKTADEFEAVVREARLEDFKTGTMVSCMSSEEEKLTSLVSLHGGIYNVLETDHPLDFENRELYAVFTTPLAAYTFLLGMKASRRHLQ